MLVSVFTPSHNPEWLADCWACLLEQTYKEWEWIIVANGDNTDTVVLSVELLCGDDPRVRVIRSTETKIGALKRLACEQALGDLFLEYDHDDLLTHDCLEAVVEAARGAPKAAFIWSDDVSCDFSGQSKRYSADWGWRQTQWTYKGKEYWINEHHPITARSMCEILYTPDHVRVWTREAYRLVGGHNKEMPYGDDHELMVRTYLKGVPFIHIARPLYFHRQDGKSTCQVKVNEIQQISRQNRDKYLYDLVKEWCRREKLPMYDLGGAHGCPLGYIPIDINPAVKQHPGGICCDVLPNVDNEDVRGLSGLYAHLKPNSVGCFRAFDFLEHIPGPQIPKLMNMLYDLLVPGGWLLTMTPAVCDDNGRAGRGAYQDPTHVSFWSSNNFWYYTKKDQAKYVPEITCRFQAARLANLYPSKFHHTHLIPYVLADLMALKDGNAYAPGPKEI